MKKYICVIDQSPYSPDLSPCDCYIFPKLKIAMKGAFYDDISAIQAFVTQALKDISLHGIKKFMHAYLHLIDRSEKCICSNGTYFE